jgi:signal transduction histidine kinase
LPEADAPIQFAAASPEIPEPLSASDIAEAAAFAWRRLQPQAESKAVAVTFEIEPRLAAACDRRELRRVLCLLLDCLLRSAPPHATIVVSARRSRGAILLRARSADRDPRAAASLFESGCHASLEEAVDQAGGTIVVDRCEIGASVSVRLAVSALNMAEQP